jgi:hypothetical protein
MTVVRKRRVLAAGRGDEVFFKMVVPQVYFLFSVSLSAIQVRTAEHQRFEYVGGGSNELGKISRRDRVKISFSGIFSG